MAGDSAPAHPAARNGQTEQAGAHQQPQPRLGNADLVAFGVIAGAGLGAVREAGADEVAAVVVVEFGAVAVPVDLGGDLAEGVVFGDGGVAFAVGLGDDAVR